MYLVGFVIRIYIITYLFTYSDYFTGGTEK